MSFSDDEAWSEIAQSVTPLQKESRDTGRPKNKIAVTPKITPNLVYHGQQLDDLTFGNMRDIDAATARKFRKEEYKIQAELDLHGCTEDQAYDMVVDFIKNSYLKQLRCVAIITGKGLHVENEDDIFQNRGVLKERVPQWLNLPEIRPLILAIDHPLPQHGGTGAIKILLRRKRY